MLLLASGNSHKVAEFRRLLAGTGLEIASAARCGGMPAVEETGTTFAANARIKAEALGARAPESAWVLADDSGLQVDFLRGAPGVFSARYAGAGAGDRDNLEKLLWALREVPENQRAARFRCVLCLIRPGAEPDYFEGACEGRIALRAAGGSGFGYDPVFIPEGFDQSFAELGEAVKAELSHRAKAAAAFRRWLDARPPAPGNRPG